MQCDRRNKCQQLSYDQLVQRLLQDANSPISLTRYGICDNGGVVQGVVLAQRGRLVQCAVQPVIDELHGPSVHQSNDCKAAWVVELHVSGETRQPLLQGEERHGLKQETVIPVQSQETVKGKRGRS